MRLLPTTGASRRIRYNWIKRQAPSRARQRSALCLTHAPRGWPVHGWPRASPAPHVRPRGKSRVLFAGRLSPEKGIYTLLETLHIDIIDQDPALTFTATTAGADKRQGKIIERLLGEHPGISLVTTCKTPARMASLMARHDIVVMPSNSQYWHETFGIVSIEAQHSGCRVIASDDGGLPETDCGGVVLVKPGNAEALAWGIREAWTAGRSHRPRGRMPG